SLSPTQSARATEDAIHGLCDRRTRSSRLFLRGQNGALRHPRHRSDVLTTETSTKLGYSS
ncbi:MAG: hypothetical protein DME51_13535, partial [Verrucomicrobia bacterium]